MKYVTKVIGDDNGDLVILFPTELLDRLQLIENEVLQWEINGKDITITRPGFIANQTKEEQE